MKIINIPLKSLIGGNGARIGIEPMIEDLQSSALFAGDFIKVSYVLMRQITCCQAPRFNS